MENFFRKAGQIATHFRDFCKSRTGIKMPCDTFDTLSRIYKTSHMCVYRKL